jgi:hypothetical protein
MSRLWKFVGLAAAALSVLIFVPQAATAVEGLGAHKGSFLVFPYYDNTGANLTFWRISMATDPGEPSVAGTFQLHMHYVAPNPAATSCGSHVPPCLETNQYITFTLNDYLLLNVDQNNRAYDYGWAYAYAVIDRPNQPIQRILWDRFFSDAVLVDTALGVASGWPNYANWGDPDWHNLNIANPLVDLNGNGLCDYSSDIHWDQPLLSGAQYPDACQLNLDFSGQNNPIFFGGNFGGANFEYHEELAADTGAIHYFTPQKRPVAGGPGMNWTWLGMMVWGWDDLQVGGWNWAPYYRFPPGPEADDACFTWNSFVYNAHERQISSSPRSIICWDQMNIDDFTLNQISAYNFNEGFVKYWDEIGPTGDESRDITILQFDSWPGLNNIEWAFYPNHERTTVPTNVPGAVLEAIIPRVDDINDW